MKDNDKSKHRMILTIQILKNRAREIAMENREGVEL